MWNLRNKTNEQRKGERERETKKQSLSYREQTEGDWGLGGVGGGYVGGWEK